MRHISAIFLLLSCMLPATALRGEEPTGPGTELTVYNQDFAVVKERRAMQLAQGVGDVRFANVAATIIPESVQFEALQPTGATVLEQNYEFDLVSASKLLQKYVDQRISIVGRDGSLIEGTLLSSDDAQIVLSNDQGIQLIPRAHNVKDIRFASLPTGLLTRPTLVWKVRAEQGGQHLVKVAYQAQGMTWRVDYRAVASPDQTELNLFGWVTVTNQSGTTYEDARLKLMAGDVNVQRGYIVGKQVFETGQAPSRRGKKGVEEKSFSEYHLYTLQQPTTLRQAQTKQLELMAIERIPVAKSYLFRSSFGDQVGVMLEFKNTAETCPGLGIPLPQGPMRVYSADAAGEVEFLGVDQLNHTPKDEPVKVRIGYAFDVKAARVMTANRRRGNEKWNQQDWQITLHNHKDQPVRVRIEESLTPNRNVTLTNVSHQYKMLDVSTIGFDVELPANGESKITYTVEYTW